MDCVKKPTHWDLFMSNRLFIYEGRIIYVLKLV